MARGHYVELSLFALVGLACSAGPVSPDLTFEESKRRWTALGREVQVYDLQQWHYDEVHPGRVVVTYQVGSSSVSIQIAKEFQTGVYDYNLMTELVAPHAITAQAELRPQLKSLVFSSQDWCGIEHETLRFQAAKATHTRRTYYDGRERVERAIEIPASSVSVDEMFLIARRLPRTRLRPGERRKVSVLPCVEHATLQLADLKFHEGEITRSSGTRTLKTKAGAFVVEDYGVRFGAEEYVFSSETEFPHRIVRWTGPRGEQAELRRRERD